MPIITAKNATERVIDIQVTKQEAKTQTLVSFKNGQLIVTTDGKSQEVDLKNVNRLTFTGPKNSEDTFSLDLTKAEEHLKGKNQRISINLSRGNAVHPEHDKLTIKGLTAKSPELRVQYEATTSIRYSNPPSDTHGKSKPKKYRHDEITIDNPSAGASFSLIRPKSLDKSSPQVNLISSDNKTSTAMQASDTIDGQQSENNLKRHPSTQHYLTPPTIKFTVDDKGDLKSNLPSYWSTISPGRISASG